MGDPQEQWHYMTAAEKDAHKRFNDFVTALGDSTPAKMARAALEVSVQHPDHYLSLTHRRVRRDEVFVDPLPPAVRQIVAAQAPTGMWEPSEALHAALGGNIPEPPSSAVGWRWATALAVACLRRYPQYFEHLEGVVTRGIRWLSTELLDKAKEALPPPDLTYDLPPELVRDHQWKSAQQVVFDELGYVGFVKREENEERHRLWHRPPTPPDEETLRLSGTLEAPIAVGELSAQTLLGGKVDLAELSRKRMARLQRLEDEAVRAKEDAEHRTLLQREHARAWSDKLDKLGPGEAILCRWRRARQFDGPSKQRTWSPAVIMRRHDTGEVDVRFTDGDQEAVHLVRPQHVRRPEEAVKARRQKRLDDFSKEWCSARTRGSEMRRLKPFSAAEYTNRRKKWDDTPVHRQSQKDKRKAPRPKPLVRTSSNTLLQSKAEKAENAAFLQSRSAGNGSGARRRQAQMISRVQRSGASSAEAMAAAQECEAAVVRCISRYERHLALVKATLAAANRTFKAASVYGQQLHAFDELTLLLGTSFEQQEGMQTVVCDLTEAVLRWRVAQAASEGDNPTTKEGEPPLPFVWGGKPILQTLRYGLDFLGSSPYLRKWYGPEYPWTGNPLATYRPIESRPRTPLPVRKRWQLLSGEPVAVEDEFDAAEKAEQWTAVEADIAKRASGASWWPGFGAGDAHWERVRAVEKELLREYGLRPWVDPTPEPMPPPPVMLGETGSAGSTPAAGVMSRTL